MSSVTIFTSSSVTKRALAPNNEWNVPDWTDLSQYPREDDSDLKWRWEFLRRDKEYRQDWLRIRAKDTKGELALLHDPAHAPPLTRPPIFCKEQQNNPFYFQRKYKLVKLLNPAHRNPRHLIFASYKTSPVTVTFDVDMPLARQLRRVTLMLKRRQAKKYGPLLRAKYPPKSKWLLYLRAIDAQDCGEVSLSEISYRVLGKKKEACDCNQASSYAQDFLERGRRFWKTLPIPRKTAMTP